MYGKRQTLDATIIALWKHIIDTTYYILLLLMRIQV